MYDAKLREKYLQERENDLRSVVDARKELEDYHKTLHEKTLTAIQKFKEDIETDVTARYEKSSQEMQDMADDGTVPLFFPRLTNTQS